MRILSKVSKKVKERGILGLIFTAIRKISHYIYLTDIRIKIGKKNIGRNCYFDGDIEIKCGEILFGNNVYVGRNVVFWGNGRIVIGDNSIISDYVSIFSDREVKIGKDCSIASFSFIIDSNHQVRKDILIHNQPKDTLPVEIGNDVWISASCVITAGSKIEDGAVIGANSVVSGKIPAYAIAMGYPARVIKNRE